MVYYHLLAEGALVLHLIWIVFLIIGGYVFLTYSWLRITHVIFLLLTFVMQIFSLDCPLTYLEDYLRFKAGQGVYYQGSFISYYLEKLVYPGIPQQIVTVLTGALVISLIVLFITKPMRLFGKIKAGESRGQPPYSRFLSKYSLNSFSVLEIVSQLVGEVGAIMS